ncbi:hypothetical protein B566_EDAN011471 [Ephemera danica]|nr:hypothetical protein B566_EDAN011471 [Ephemera danica]
MAAAINAIPSPTLSPSSWPLQTLNGRKYYVDISSAEFTWYAAQAECMKHGMELATIGSQAEHDAITNYIQGAGKGGSEFFIGGNKMGTQCIYVWDNGEPMTYTNWNTGNPAQQTTEECMTWYDGKWNDLPCSWTKWFICEEVDETTTTTTSTTTTSTTTTTTPCPLACKTSSCLASDGLKTAAINGVPSPTLRILLTVFISGNKIGGQCNYGWESGEPMTYTNWYPGDPAQATIEECMVWYDNKWGDFPCDWTRWFLCEQI